MRLSSLLVWGHSTQHFPDLSTTFAMLSVTPVLGLEELTVRWVLWAAGRCEQLQQIYCFKACAFENCGRLGRLPISFPDQDFPEEVQGV